MLGIDVNLLNFGHGLALSELIYQGYIIRKLVHSIAARHPMWARASSSIATLIRRVVAVVAEAWVARYLLEVTGPEDGILLRERTRPAGQPFPAGDLPAARLYPSTDEQPNRPLAVCGADPQYHRASTRLEPMSAS